MQVLELSNTDFTMIAINMCEKSGLGDKMRISEATSF
jgi:hypothetical protein